MSTNDFGTVVVTTSAVSFISGFLLGVYALRGWLISPSLKSERHANLHDPIESDEEDVSEVEALDHAPNWANSAAADKRDGLRSTPQSTPQKKEDGMALTAGQGSSKKKNKKKNKDVDTALEAAASAPAEETKKNKLPMPLEPLDFSKTNKNEECKLMLVVRTDLGMTKGKIAAQCSHATLACYETITKKPKDSHHAQFLSRWKRSGQAKVAVQVKSQEDIVELFARARGLGLVAEVIQDAGRTQIEAGSLTVLGVGPAPKSAVDMVTGGLKLL